MTIGIRRPDTTIFTHPSHSLVRGWRWPDLADVQVLLVGLATFAGITAMFALVGFNPVHSDVLGYLQWSRVWWFVRDQYHLPGYPALLWLVRTLTGGRLDGAPLLDVVALGAWIAAVRYVSLTLATEHEGGRAFGTALFALFPFVGVAYVAWPTVDAIAAAALTAAIYYLVRRAWWRYTIAVAMALVIHKVLWPYMGLLTIVAIWRSGYPVRRIVLAAVPLGVYWLWGVVDGGGVLWIVHTNLHAELSSHSQLPVLDGVLGTLLAGGVRGWGKGTVLIALGLANVALAVSMMRRRDGLMLALTIPTLILFVILNQHEAWAFVRFGRILALPAAVVVAEHRAWRATLARPAVWWALIVMLVVLQVAFAYYMATAYFA
ncbi:MAG TPA: hypothetical protein VFJ96_05420 [Gemmatimonadaceae bacterium]|nr:hypothetical protein [Gemmatimonadaceae bacterium]